MKTGQSSTLEIPSTSLIKDEDKDEVDFPDSI